MNIIRTVNSIDVARKHSPCGPTGSKQTWRAAVWRFLLLCTLGVSLPSGCSSGAKPGPLDGDQAHQAIRSFLETWKSGKPIQELEVLNPKIVSNDEDWTAGKFLSKYEIKSEGRDDGANLHITVVLQLAAKKGARSKKSEVTYVVGTSPVLTVMRE